jgi:heavy metal sensor kinase
MKNKFFTSLSFRLTLWYIVILAGIIVLAGFFIHQRFRDGLVNDLDARLLEIANDVDEIWSRSRGVTWEDAARTAAEENRDLSPLIQVVELEDRDGIKSVVAPSILPEGAFTLGERTYRRADRADIDELMYQTLEKKELDHHPLRVLLYPVRGPVIVQVGVSLGVIDTELRRLLIIMAISGVLVTFLASLGGNFILRQALRPVRSVVETARKISAEDLSLRIDARKRRDEIGELVDTVNDMIARLDKSVRKIKQFSGDVSHELRTPLTIIRGEVEVLLRKERSPEEYRKTLRSALEETHNLEAIIDDLLFLSRLEAIAGTSFQKPVGLDEALLGVVESREPSAKAKGLRLKIAHADEAGIKGDEGLLTRMIANLLDNAIRYTPAGGEVEVDLEKKEGTCVLTVRDTGIGIPEEAIPSIFDRFYVVDGSRSRETGGSGLGLSIVKHVAEIHGARIEVESEVGKGALFRIVFPR